MADAVTNITLYCIVKVLHLIIVGFPLKLSLMCTKGPLRYMTN